MFEKDLNVGLLLDFYGEVLSEHTRAMMEMYYNEDLSLSEIADAAGISRQGVRHLIKKGEEELTVLEDRLGLCRQAAELRPLAEEILRLAAQNGAPESRALADTAAECARIILNRNKEVDDVSGADRKTDRGVEKIPQ